MHSVSGWIGSVLLGFCGFPQAYKSFKDGHSDGLSATAILMWTSGELFGTYAVFTDTHSPYLLMNYVVNIFLLIVMCRYKFFPRRRIASIQIPTVNQPYYFKIFRPKIGDQY